uniref:RxLR effector candidate protein n=1 Tax=Peronospora matthiolae TaxID=2874970 RepID=A0AAV1T8X6_9STRA
MRLYLSAGLVSSALLVSAAFALASAEPDPAALGVLEDQRHTTGRLLRGSTDEKRDSEEERLMHLPTPPNELLGVEQRVTEAFVRLNLKMPTFKNGEFVKEEVTAFLSSRKLRTWYHHAKKTGKMYAAFAPFNVLERALTPEVLARMIQRSILQKGNFPWNVLSFSKPMARILEEVQFDKWRSLGYTKADVNRKVLRLPEGAVDPISVQYGQTSKKKEGKEGKYLFDY